MMSTSLVTDRDAGPRLHFHLFSIRQIGCLVKRTPSLAGEPNRAQATLAGAQAQRSRPAPILKGTFLLAGIFSPAPTTVAAWGSRVAAVRRKTVPQSTPAAGAIANAIVPPTAPAAESSRSPIRGGPRWPRCHCLDSTRQVGRQASPVRRRSRASPGEPVVGASPIRVPMACRAV